MKQALFIATALLTMTATRVHAAIEEHYGEKSISIQKAGADEEDKQVKIRVGEKVAYELSIYQSVDSDGYTVIVVSMDDATVDDTIQQAVELTYSISFHDKHGKLIGCQQFFLEVDPEDAAATSGRYNTHIFVNSQSISSVTNYKLRARVVKLQEH